jgi:hypothetical protein
MQPGTGKKKSKWKKIKPGTNERMNNLNRSRTRNYALQLVGGHALVVYKAKEGVVFNNPLITAAAAAEKARKLKARSFWAEVNDATASPVAKTSALWNVAAGAASNAAADTAGVDAVEEGGDQVLALEAGSIDAAIAAAREAADRAERETEAAATAAVKIAMQAAGQVLERAVSVQAQAQSIYWARDPLCEVRYGFEEPSLAQTTFITTKAKSEAYNEYPPTLASMLCSSMDKSLRQTVTAIAALVARAAAKEAKEVWEKLAILPIAHAICRAVAGGMGDTAFGVRQSFQPLFWQYRRLAIHAENEARKAEQWVGTTRTEQLAERVETIVRAKMLEDGLSEIHVGLFFGEVGRYGGSRPWVPIRGMAIRHLFLHGTRIASSSVAVQSTRRHDGRNDVDGTYCQLCCERSSNTGGRVAESPPHGLVDRMPGKGAGAMRAWCAVHDWYLPDGTFEEDNGFGACSLLAPTVKNSTVEQKTAALAPWNQPFNMVKVSNVFTDFSPGARIRSRREGFSLRRLATASFQQVMDTVAAAAAAEETAKETAKVGGAAAALTANSEGGASTVVEPTKVTSKTASQPAAAKAGLKAMSKAVTMSKASFGAALKRSNTTKKAAVGDGASMFAATAMVAAGTPKMRAIAGALPRKAGARGSKARAERQRKKVRQDGTNEAEETDKKKEGGCGEVRVRVPAVATVQTIQPIQTSPHKQKKLSQINFPSNYGEVRNERTHQPPPHPTPTPPSNQPSETLAPIMKVPEPLGLPGIIGLRWLNKRTVYRYYYGQSCASQYLYAGIAIVPLRPWRYAPTPTDAFALSKDERRARFAAREAKEAEEEKRRARAKTRAQGMGKKIGKRKGKKKRKQSLEKIRSNNQTESAGEEKQYFWATRYASNRQRHEDDPDRDWVPHHLRCMPSNVLKVCHSHAFNIPVEGELGDDDAAETGDKKDKSVEDKSKTGWRKINKFAKLAAAPTMVQVAANAIQEIHDNGIRAKPRQDATIQTNALKPLLVRSRDRAPFLQAIHGRRFQMLLPNLKAGDGDESSDNWSMVAQLSDIFMHYNNVLRTMVNTFYIHCILRVQYRFRNRRRKRAAKRLCRVFRRFLQRKFAAIKIQRWAKAYVRRKWAAIKIELMLRRRIWRKRRQQRAARLGAAAALYAAMCAWIAAAKASAIVAALAAAHAAANSVHAAKRLEYCRIAATRWQKRWRGHIHREYCKRYKEMRLAMVIRLQYMVRWRQNYLRVKMVGRVQRRFRERQRTQAAATVKLALCGTINGWLWRRSRLNRAVASERRRRMGEVMSIHTKSMMNESVSEKDRQRFARRFREHDLKSDETEQKLLLNLAKDAAISRSSVGILETSSARKTSTLDRPALNQMQSSNAKKGWAKLRQGTKQSTASRAFAKLSNTSMQSMLSLEPAVSGELSYKVNKLSSADAQVAILLHRLQLSDEALRFRRRLMRQTKQEGTVDIEQELSQLMDKGFIDEDSDDEPEDGDASEVGKKQKAEKLAVMVQVPQTSTSALSEKRWRWVWNGYPMSLQTQIVHEKADAPSRKLLKGWEWVHDVRDIFATYLRYELSAGIYCHSSLGLLPKADEESVQESVPLKKRAPAKGAMKKMGEKMQSSKALLKSVVGAAPEPEEKVMNYFVSSVSLAHSNGHMSYQCCLMLLQRSFRLNLHKEPEKAQHGGAQQKHGGTGATRSLFKDSEKAKEKKDRFVRRLRAELMMAIDHDRVGYITLPFLLRFLWKATHVLSLGEKFVLREEMKQTEEAKERDREKRRAKAMKGAKPSKPSKSNAGEQAPVGVESEARKLERTQKEEQEVEDLVEEVADIYSFEGFESARVEAKMHLQIAMEAREKKKRKKEGVVSGNAEGTSTPLNTMLVALQHIEVNFDQQANTLVASKGRMFSKKATEEMEEVEEPLSPGKTGGGTMLARMKGNHTSHHTSHHNSNADEHLNTSHSLPPKAPPSWHCSTPVTVLRSFVKQFRAGEGAESLLSIDGTQPQAPRFECPVCLRAFALPSHYREHCAVPHLHEWRKWMPWKGNGQYSRGIHDFSLANTVTVHLHSNASAAHSSTPPLSGSLVSGSLSGLQKLSSQQASHLSHNACSEQPLVQLTAFEKVWAAEAVGVLADWVLDKSGRESGACIPVNRRMSKVELVGIDEVRHPRIEILPYKPVSHTNLVSSIS